MTTKQTTGVGLIVTPRTDRSKVYVDYERDGRPFLVFREGVLSWDDIAAVRAILDRAKVD